MSTIKERIENLGAGSLLDHEAINVLTGIPMESLIEYKNIMDLKNGYKAIKLSPTQKNKLETFFELNKRLTSQYELPSKISSPEDMYNLVKGELIGLDKEIVMMIMLDTKCRLIGIEVISVGTLSGSLLHPREVFKPAIINSAYSIVLAHNHPSNDTTPSEEDIRITKRLMEAGNIIGIPVIDHIIVGSGFLSMREECYI